MNKRSLREDLSIWSLYELQINGERVMIRMLGQNNQISELEDIMVRNDLFKKFRLSKLGVFGSTARGEVSNDIDILIEDNVDYRSLSVFRAELNKLTNKRIDIVIARYANPIVLHRARKEIIYVTGH
ncbi:nucleotidyltransferase domain-containing protein [Desulfosporosinus sp. I2]|uniref:nucleotidyltransferase family protein n=1 Tax=Desulfosporosinus sp. I2 TaxID=1617025 RepID=UPI001FA6E7CF|nr:nucleotidyltransferase domain-containing protein [Desulfosporosinus sp. I2]